MLDLYRNSIILSVLILSATGAETFASGGNNNAYPKIPNHEMTVGSLCKDPDEYRYPEHIPYCERSVSTGTKNDIIKQYDEKFGHNIRSMPRTDFKIDHLIPLCMGGSNEVKNLWPQHKTVFNQTDKIEQLLCEMLAAGKIKQAKAIDVLMKVKEHPETGPSTYNKYKAASQQGSN